MPDWDVFPIGDFELSLRLPELECPHGRHVGDNSPPCGCYASELPPKESGHPSGR